MSIPTCVSCQERLSCSDSPLSVTGNVIGILTFAGAFLISIQVYINSMRNADRNLQEMTYTFQSRMDEVRHLANKLERQSSRIDGDSGGRLHFAMNQVKEGIDQAGKLLDRLKDRRYSKGNRLWIRAKFIMREDLIKEGLGKTEKAMGTLRDVANDIFSDRHSEIAPEAVANEVAFRSEILQRLVDMRNEMDNLRENNAALLQEMRDLLQDSISQPPSSVA